MKILHTVESYLPARHGMSEVVRQLSEGLVSLGHEVIVATSTDTNRSSDIINGVQIYSFDIKGKSALGIFGNTKAYQKFLIDFDGDIIVNFAAQQWATDLTFPVLTKINAKKIIVPTGFSGLRDQIFRNYYEKMRNLLNLYDASVFLSSDYQDISFARECIPHNKIVVIPNGASKNEFLLTHHGDIRTRLQIPVSHKLIIHVSGYLSADKGQLETIKIFNKSEIRNASLVLVSPGFSSRINQYIISPITIIGVFYDLIRGRGLRRLLYPIRLFIEKQKYAFANKQKSRQILTKSLTRSETVSLFKQSDLFLFPSKTECSPLVLFEACASSTPFLVTDVGNAKEIITWTGGGALLPTSTCGLSSSLQLDIIQSAKQLDSIMNDTELRHLMATKAHSAWQAHFTWEQITLLYQRLYEHVLKNHSNLSALSSPVVDQ